jgi:hypothetical protein
VRGVINIVWRLSVAAELIVAARLLLQGLGGIYPALLTASCVFALRSSLLILAFQSRSMGRDVWKMTQPIDWLVSCWIVLELFSKWTRSYPGIGRFGRFLFGVLVIVALSVSVAWWPIEWKSLLFDHDLRIYYFLSRFVWATLALFTLLIWLFFRNYPAAVAPNVVRHTHITATYFTVCALSELAFTLNGRWVLPLVNFLIVAITAACFSAWAILLTRKGEDRDAIVAISPDEAARIERINQELLGLMKKIPGEIGVRRTRPKKTARPPVLK